MKPSVQAGREEVVQQEWGPWAFGPFSWNLIVLRGCSGLVSCIPLPFGDAVLLCMPDFTG